MEERTVVKVNIGRSAQARIKAIAQQLGVKQQEMFGRLIEWFTAQPLYRQKACIANLSDADIRKLAGEIDDATAEDEHPHARGIARELSDDFIEDLRGPAAPRKTTKKRGA